MHWTLNWASLSLTLGVLHAWQTHSLWPPCSRLLQETCQQKRSSFSEEQPVTKSLSPLCGPQGMCSRWAVAGSEQNTFPQKHWDPKLLFFFKKMSPQRSPSECYGPFLPEFCSKNLHKLILHFLSSQRTESSQVYERLLLWFCPLIGSLPQPHGRTIASQAPSRGCQQLFPFMNTVCDHRFGVLFFS